MRILGWNCQGICNASTARALRATIRAQNPDFVFLCETKVFDDDRLKKLAVSIGFSEQLIVNAKGKASGVCLLWSSALDVEVLEFNSQTIAVVVNDVLCSWALIGFYGPPYQAKRRKAWENLHVLLQSLNCPWICFGDFNVVVEESEKFGGQRGSNSTPSYLKDLLFDLGAIDLGFAGAKYTWWNKRWGKNAIKERLDRAICNSGWRTQFPKASVFHLEATNSDHAPLLIDSNPKEEFLLRPFKFEAMWTRDPRCSGVVKEAWKLEVPGSSSFVLCKKQVNTTLALKK